MRKGTHHTEESKQKNSEAHKGIPHSEESKQKNSNAQKGKIPWNKGIPASEEHRQKNSKSQKGILKSKEHNQKNSDAQKGNKNHNWKGGISYLPYCPKFNKKLKEEVRNKFGRKCFLCNKTELENNGKNMCVHHIDYDKEQGCNGKTFELVPLCRSCHSKTNGERDEQQIMIINKLRAMNDTCN